MYILIVLLNNYRMYKQYYNTYADWEASENITIPTYVKHAIIRAIIRRLT